MRKICLFFLIVLPLFAQDSEGGQQVEGVEVKKPPLEELAKEPEALQELDSSKLLSRDALAKDVVGERPPPTDQPTIVKVGLFVDDVAKISDVDQSFTASIRVIVRWVDKRLADPEKKIRTIPVGEAWFPLVRIANGRDLKTELEDGLYVDESGHVIWGQRYSGTFTAPLNLQNFPFDRHKLSIFVRSFYSPEEVRFVIDESLTGWAERLTIPDWIVKEGKAEINAFFSPEQKKEMSQFEFSFRIERLSGFYFWKAILPLSLIVIMSWGVLWIDPHRLEAQIGLSATAFLTLFAFQFAIATLLPRIAYLTRMDRFTLLCSLLVLLALIEAIIKSFLVKKGRAEVGYSIDRICRFAFPLAFLAIILFAFFL